MITACSRAAAQRYARRFQRLLIAAVATSSLAASRTYAQRAPCSDRAPQAPRPATPKAPLVSADSQMTVSNDSGPVDVVIFAAAQVGEIRFASQPSIHVRLCGGLDSVHVLERRNLPDPVVAGTTYRDVYVAVQIFGRLTADCIARELRASRIAGDSLDARAPSRADCAS